MNCFTHITVPAVAQCKKCGKFLCKECAARYPKGICQDCADAISEKKHSAITIRNAVTFTVFICSVLLISLTYYHNGAFEAGGRYEGEPFWHLIVISSIFSFYLAGIFFGWCTLTQAGFKIPENIIIFDILIILFFGILKFVLSCFIGWLCLTWYLLKLLFLTIKNAITKYRI